LIPKRPRKQPLPSQPRTDSVMSPRPQSSLSSLWPTPSR
jgi:hypothetical protein